MVRWLPWSEAFSIGHEGLDGEHRRLVELINDVIAAVHSKTESEQPSDLLPNLLQTLRETAVAHLRNENAILWELRQGTYTGLRSHARTPQFVKAMAGAAFDEHMAEHEKLLSQFDDAIALPLDTLCETLKSWFLDHAIKHDSHLKTIFQAA
jgi:hemerythrin-like metal-binding protein